MEKFPREVLTDKQITKQKKQEEWLQPVNGIITSSCGERENPILNKMEYHNGLDIAVAEDTNAIAVRSGIVTEVRNSETLGKHRKFVYQSCLKNSEFYHAPANVNNSATGRKSFFFA